MARTTATKQTMEQDLKRSGLTKVDAGRLGMKTLTPTETNRLVGKKAQSYRIPYFGIDGQESEFFRVRFLESVARFGGNKSRRYSQPKDTLPGVYAPPLLKVRWSRIAKDPALPIAITEGEKKAAKACKAGLPTLGLGGVWAWRSKKAGVYFLPDLDAVTWEARDVRLIFDSDQRTNPDVLHALYALAGALTKRGAEVSILFLPDAPGGESQGLDDFLLTHTLSDLLELESIVYKETSELWDLNTKVAFIHNPASYLHIPTNQLFRSTKQLVDGPFAPYFMTKYIENTQGDFVPKQVNTAAEWAKWPHRREHKAIVYAPGKPQVLEDGSYNNWKGWGVEPKKGDIKPFLWLFDHVFGDLPEGLQHWVWCWLAYPLQYPGAKLLSYILIHGRAQGTGKSFIGYIMGDIYGRKRNFSKIRQRDLYGTHNGWLANRQFILGEEITGGDKRHAADELKDLVTNEIVTINQKYVPEYEIDDLANYWLTSNQPDAAYLEDDDRRGFIHRLERKADFGKYQGVDKWRREDDGPAALFHYLLHEVDTSQFNPKAPAPFTEAKRDMIANSRTDVESWVDDLITDPDSVLVTNGVPIKRDVFTSDELVELYDPDGMKRANPTSLGRALERRVVPKYHTQTPSGYKRLRAVRNLDYWHTASRNAWVANYEGDLSLLDSKRQRRKGNEKTTKPKRRNGGKT